MSARENKYKVMQTDINLTEINSIYKQGYALFTDGHYSRALRLFYAAWLQIPKPQTDYPIATTVLTGIGNAYFKMRKYKLAIEALRSALSCPKTAEQGLMLLRLGQSLHAIGSEQQAHIYLRRAHSIGGHALFANEHPKYLRAIEDFII